MSNLPYTDDVLKALAAASAVSLVDLRPDRHQRRCALRGCGLENPAWASVAIHPDPALSPDGGTIKYNPRRFRQDRHEVKRLYKRVRELGLGEELEHALVVGICARRWLRPSLVVQNKVEVGLLEV